MKNKHMEYKRSLWKNARPRHRIPNKDGVVIYHCYTEGDRAFSWWDDFGFFINGVYHAVWWIHPRMDFSDKCEALAYTNTTPLYPGRARDWLGDSKPIWHKRGKSRKKIVMYEMSPTNNSYEVWGRVQREETNKILKSTDIVIHPSIKTEWLSYGKGISICYPVELFGEKEIAEFALKLKRSILTGVPLDMSGSYSKDNWQNEGHKER